VYKIGGKGGRVKKIRARFKGSAFRVQKIIVSRLFRLDTIPHYS
jgi:hypothetical protein